MGVGEKSTERFPGLPATASHVRGMTGGMTLACRAYMQHLLRYRVVADFVHRPNTGFAVRSQVVQNAS